MFFVFVVSDMNKAKSSLLKAMASPAWSCSSFFLCAAKGFFFFFCNLFLSPTVCAAVCFTVEVQTLLDGARMERTEREREKEMKRRERCGHCLIWKP